MLHPDSSPTEHYLFGMSLIGSINDPERASDWVFIVNGHHDVSLAHAFFFSANGRVANEGENPAENLRVQSGIANIKTILRNQIKQILDPVGFAKEQEQNQKDLNKRFEQHEREQRRAYREKKESEERAEKQKRDAFNSQHKPAPEGTVKELAQKFGKSLSEIRRLKAAGELHTLTV